jgi:hypothetical protein
VSAITLAELWFGAAKSSRPQRTRESVDAFLKPFEVLPFEAKAAEKYAEVHQFGIFGFGSAVSGATVPSVIPIRRQGLTSRSRRALAQSLHNSYVC